MGRLQTKAADCDCGKYDRRLMEQFIHELDNEGMISEIVRKVSALEDMDETTSEGVLLWAKVAEAQGVQEEA